MTCIIYWAICVIKSSNTTIKQKQKYFQILALKNEKTKVLKLEFDQKKTTKTNMCFLLRYFSLWWDCGWYCPYYNFWSSVFKVSEPLFLNYSCLLLLFNVKSVLVRKKGKGGGGEKRRASAKWLPSNPVGLSIILTVFRWENRDLEEEPKITRLVNWSIWDTTPCAFQNVLLTTKI